jgi:hypothetical protein
VRVEPVELGVQVRETVEVFWLLPGTKDPTATTPPVEFRTVTVPLGAITPPMADTSVTIVTATPAWTSPWISRSVVVGMGTTRKVESSTLVPPLVAVKVHVPAALGVQGK